MNSYVRLFNGDKLTSRWIGWNSRRDRQIFFGSVFAAFAMYAGVYFSEEKERNRRHQSIEKDIERERWRAQELGLAQPSDDGFADRYLNTVKKDRGG